MRLADIEKVFDRGVAADICRLPPPLGVIGATVKAKTTFRLASVVFRAWKHLLLKNPNPPDEADSPTEEPLAFACQVAGTYYDLLVNRLLANGLPPGQPLPPGINIPTLDWTVDTLKSAADDPIRAENLYLMHRYLVSRLAARFIPASFELPPLQPDLAFWEQATHGALVDTHQLQLSATHQETRSLAGQLLHSALHDLHSIYGRYSAPSPHTNRRFGPFSALRISELPDLAARRDHVRRRYGQRLPRVFETQLALLLQSLGFYVVSARLAESTVDLYCISPDASTPATFMVEAKTTARAYSLPPRDARALLSYIKEVQSTLSTLPRLRFALIIGPSPSQTLAAKLVHLEAQAGVPIRYCNAVALVNLREALPGPVPIDSLLSSVLTGEHILPDDFGQLPAQELLMRQQLHSQFVRGLLLAPANAHDSHPPLGSWGPNQLTQDVAAKPEGLDSDSAGGEGAAATATMRA